MTVQFLFVLIAVGAAWLARRDRRVAEEHLREAARLRALAGQVARETANRLQLLDEESWHVPVSTRLH